jgi:hypothetical protein
MPRQMRFNWEVLRKKVSAMDDYLESFINHDLKSFEITSEDRAWRNLKLQVDDLFKRVKAAKHQFSYGEEL